MEQLKVYCGYLLIVLGFISIICGMVVMVRRVFSKELEDTAKEIKQLIKKGVIADVGSTLESASFLVREMTSLIQSANGIGLTLIFVGGALIYFGYKIIEMF